MSAPIAVEVKFDKRVPMDLRARALMAFEGYMRERGCYAEVFVERIGDDSKLRNQMTPEERAKL